MPCKFAASLILLAGLFTSQTQAQEIGWINSIEGESDSIRLLRQGHSDPVKPFTTLRAGDQLQIGDSRSAVVIGTPDGKNRRIGAAQSPFTVSAPGNAPSMQGNVFKWVSGLFPLGAKKETTLALSSMSTRGANTAPLAVPYLTRRFLVEARTRQLYLSWSGGTPPFRLRLVSQTDGKDIIALVGIGERHVLAPRRELAEGNYLLEISDAADNVFEDLLRAVPAANLPVFPEPAGLAGLDPNTARIIEAGWLGTTENGRWVIEAIQRLHELAPNPAALTVLRRLEQGVTVD